MKAQAVVVFGAAGHPGGVLGEVLAAAATQPARRAVQHIDRPGKGDVAGSVLRDANGQVGKAVLVEVCPQAPGVSGRCGLAKRLGDAPEGAGEDENEDNDHAPHSTTSSRAAGLWPAPPATTAASALLESLKR